MITRRTNFFRSAAAMLLAIIMLFSVLPVLAETVGSDSGLIPEGTGTLSYSEKDTYHSSSGPSNAEAFNQYILGVLYPRKALSEAKSNSSLLLRNRLNKDEKVLYDALLAKIQKVAAGKSSSTHFEISSFKPKFTRKSVNNSENNVRAKVRTMVINVYTALMGDCPSEMYWYDKTYGAGWDFNVSYDSTYCKISGFYMEFAVAKEYSAYNAQGTIKVSTSKAKAVQKAAANAQKIVQENRGKSDTAKLKAYRDAICALNEYNTAAATDSTMPYGNPWQLVWVFDGDTSTNVVCEGYSKAFQYLCELSSFSGSISVMSMSGIMTNPATGSGGRHMWNVVTMPDKKNYLVDVTNCDQGSYGSDDLFLSGCAYTIDTYFTDHGLEYTTGYVYDTDFGIELAYFYDVNPEVKIYKKSDRVLHTSAFNPASDTTKASGTCSKNVEWSLNKGVLKIGGTGAIPNYSSSSPAPWKKYAAGIKKIVIGDSITQVGNYAFNGLKAAKSVTLGKNVKKICKYAFNGCKKVTTFTIKGTKLKTIGTKAFKGFPKKVTFVCPSKKLSAYKKLLLKKGAPKTATFKK